MFLLLTPPIMYLPSLGDLLIDQQYTIEIGGPGKSFHQIANMPNPIFNPGY